MPRNGRRRSTAQIRHMETMRKRRWASPNEAKEISEASRCESFEEYKSRMVKAEREAEKNQRDLKNAERRLVRMAEKVGGTKRETGDLEHQLDQAKEQTKTAMAECARWEGKSVELQRALRRVKDRERRGPKGIFCAVQSAMATLANSGLPLKPPSYRIEGRIYELVNELAFSWRLPTPIIAGVINSVSRATVDVCYDGHVDHIDIDVDEHRESDEHEREREGSPAMDVAVAGPSSAVVLPPEETGM